MSPAEALARTLAADRGRIAAALVRRLGDLDAAEDALQEAAASALVHWARVGVPARPDGWLVRVALRKAIDRVRRGRRDEAGREVLAQLAADEVEAEERLPDARLGLVFACCHPALEPKSRVALTLRLLGGLSTAEIAAAFLDAEPTMGQRLSRAKAKLAAAKVRFEVPGPEAWAERLASVLDVLYLIFNAGHAAPGRDLCEEAIFLARLVDALRPGEAEVEGALALMLLTHARRAARRDAEGVTVALAEQDRGLWDRGMIDEGLAVLDRAVARRRPGPFQVKAAIAACHAAEVRDWREILALYDALLRMEPTPVVALNRAVALAEACGAERGLEAVLPLAAALTGYQPFHAVHAELASRLGRRDEARAAYDRAIALAGAADATFLTRRRATLDEGARPATSAG